MRFVLIAAAVCGLVAACGDNASSDTPLDAAPIDARVDAAPDSAVPLTTGPCLDQPSDLPRPPTGPLACDLLPPGSVAR